MYKKTLLSLVICSIFVSIQSAYAVCASKIIFVQDDSISVQPRINEANNIKTALTNAVGAANYIHIPFSRAHELGEQAMGEAAGTDGSTGWGYSLPNLTLASAVQRCDQNCATNDGNGRTYKCAIVYWGDNVITHKNPNLAIHDYNAMKKTMDDSNDTALNSSHRFFIDLSFQSNDVDPQLQAMSEEVRTYTQRATYRGIDFRNGAPEGTLTADQVNAIVAAILDRFGHSE